MPVTYKKPRFERTRGSKRAKRSGLRLRLSWALCFPPTLAWPALAFALALHAALTTSWLTKTKELKVLDRKIEVTRVHSHLQCPRNGGTGEWILYQLYMQSENKNTNNKIHKNWWNTGKKWNKLGYIEKPEKERQNQRTKIRTEHQDNQQSVNPVKPNQGCMSDYWRYANKYVNKSHKRLQLQTT